MRKKYKIKGSPIYQKRKSILIPKVSLTEDYYISSMGLKAIPSVPERRIAKVLREKNVNFLQEVSFKRFGHPFSPYRFDFFIPHLCIIIEYDGKQHSKSKIHANDLIKNQFC